MVLELVATLGLEVSGLLLLCHLGPCCAGGDLLFLFNCSVSVRSASGVFYACGGLGGQRERSQDAALTGSVAFHSQLVADDEEAA